MPQFDLMILGTGPAATQVALRCSRAGRQVGIVDPRPFGGTCALRGCNPKKVLVRAAELYDWIRRAEGTGLQVDGARIEWSELIDFKRWFADPITPWKENKFKEAGIEQFHGSPRFVSPEVIAVEDQEVQSKAIVVATGAEPLELGIPGEELLTSSADFLELDDLPRRVLFVGAGFVTFEFAHVAARAGAEVTILERLSQPLPHFEAELVECLVERSREIGIDLQTSTEVRSIEKQPDGSLNVTMLSGDTQRSVEVDLVVHGAGRVPNTRGLELDRGNVRYGPKGIEVDQYLQSVSNPAVYAAGDVAASGGLPLSPVAIAEGKTLAHNLLNEDKRSTDYGPVATAVFSVPALAAVGLLEDDARDRGFEFDVHTGDRADDNSMKKVGAKHARYKVLVEKTSDRILGAHLLGPDAAETINLFTLAMRHGITASQLKSTLLLFPTFAHDVRGMT